MMDFSNSTIVKAIAHEVGNKFREEGISYSEKDLDLGNSDTHLLFTRFLLSSFKGNEFFNFFHPTNIEMNEIYSYVSNIFNNVEDFESNAKKIALHLYNESTHPKINRGEIYVVHFADCLIDDEIVDAIGIFKSETKENYLKALKKGHQYMLTSEKGINVEKLDKGCIIFNTDKEHGFKVALVNSSRSDDAQYWKDRFLKVTPSNDNYHSTQNYLSLTKAFVTKQLKDEKGVDSAVKADLLNKSVEYFKNNSKFTEKEFTSEVFSNPKVASSFEQFKDEFTRNSDVTIEKDFQISPQVVKKQSKNFKSVIKLDKNFHIYVHGKPDLISKGFDEETGKYFYKVFFDSES